MSWLALIVPHVLTVLLLVGVAAQIVLAVRIGEAGPWLARRWALWVLALFSAALQIIVQVEIGLPTSAVIFRTLLADLGAALVTLTITGAIIAGIARRVGKGRRSATV